MTQFRTGATGASLVILISLSACSADRETGRLVQNNGVEGNAGSSAMGGVGSAGREGTDPGTSDQDLFADEGVTVPDGGPMELAEGEACTGQVAETERVPAVLQLLVDTSGSMALTPDGNDPVPGEDTKWDITRRGLAAAISAMPASTSVGVIYYPLSNRCLNEEVGVTIAGLAEPNSAQRQRLLNSMADIQPNGGTPTHDALRFATEELIAAPAAGNKFVVLITDGAPTYALNCQGTGQRTDPVDPAPLVTETMDAKLKGIGTFVIGSPGSELDGYQGIDPRVTLSEMANAGGTAPTECSDQGPKFCHFDMTAEVDFAEALNRALADISGEVVSCAYEIPEPPLGETLDPDRVNVLFTPGGGVVERFLRDDACTEGWRYSEDGTMLELCGTACDRVKQDPAGRVEIEFGCDTDVIIK